MRSPPHPGRIVGQECLEPLGLGVGEAAARLGVPVADLAPVLAGEAPITRPLAEALAAAFGSSVWLRLQRSYDAAEAHLRREDGNPGRGVTAP
jgi:addiction module HigA family antidote